MDQAYTKLCTKIMVVQHVVDHGGHLAPELSYIVNLHITKLVPYILYNIMCIMINKKATRCHQPLKKIKKNKGDDNLRKQPRNI